MMRLTSRFSCRLLLLASARALFVFATLAPCHARLTPMTCANLSFVR